jgi:hypothetical protein
MTVKVRFMFVLEASATSSQTTVLNVKQMQIEGDTEIYVFPPELQSSDNHTELMATASARSARKSLTLRGNYRNPHITLTDTVAALYIDADGNPVFGGEMLAPLDDDDTSSMHSKKSSVPQDTSAVISPPTKSLSTILKDAVLEKFGSSTNNANMWIETFESECRRLEITSERFWEAIRPFLEGPAIDWFNAARISLKTSPAWDRWRSSFLDAFATKGWSDARTSFNFRFIGGSLAEYALKKQSLLVNFNPKMDDATKIALIVAGLPLSVQERLERSEIDSVSKLLSKINSLERPVRPQFSSSSFPRTHNSNRTVYSTKNLSRSNVPCPYCEKKGFPNLLHPETECRRKYFNNLRSSGQANSYTPQQSKSNDKRSLNVTEINDTLTEIQKN